MYVYKAAKEPWSNFPIKYGFIDIFSLDIILRICRAIDTPPNPNKKAQIIMPVEISLLGITDIMETPFVSSNIPVKIPFE